AVSIVLSAAMLVTALPADLLGGVANVEAAEKTYVLDAATLSASKDKEEATGNLGTDNYFSVQGTVQKRVSSGKVTSLETAKKGGGSLQFTVTNDTTASLTLNVSSNGSTNYSDVVLRDTNGNNVTATDFQKGNDSCSESGGVYTIYSNSDTSTLVYGNLSSGTYTITSPGNTGDTNGRGIRIKLITVVETSGSGGGGEGDDDEKPNPGKAFNPEEYGTTDGLDPEKETVGDVTWTFPVKPGDANPQVKYEGSKNKGGYRGLTIDATVGKFAVRDGDAQTNAGVKILVPVDGPCEITVTAKSGHEGKFSVNGETATAEKNTITYWGTKKFVVVEALANGYLSAISVKHINTKKISVTGAITNEGDVHPDSTKLIFTCVENGVEEEVAIAKGADNQYSYEASLNDGCHYEVSLKDANGWIVSEGASFSIDLGAENKTNDIKIKKVGLVTVTGTISASGETANGVTDESVVLKDAVLVATSQVEGTIYVPEITIDATNKTYTAKLEKGIDYVLSVKNVNDYEIPSDSNTWKYDADATDVSVELKAKALHKITIDAVDVDENKAMETSVLSSATFTFTNTADEYVYTFTGTDAIKLRDGIYSVKVSNAGQYAQNLTSNVTVNGADLTKTINFSIPTVWDFSSDDWKNSKTNGAGNYNGLRFTNAQVDQTYMVAKSGANVNGSWDNSAPGTVSVPVKGNSKVIVTACYKYSFYFEADTEDSYNKNTGSTGKLDVFTYNYTGGAGNVDITIAGQSYLCKIEVIPVVAYKNAITVNPDGSGDYKTINEALAAVKAMDRPKETGKDTLERVTISIAPGDYEEMLVVDVPNVTLKNASDNPSIELKDQGVHIDDNAVRITHYYGHGYTYYSMGSDCKWDAETLAVNKENGKESFVNPGSGTTSGSYWNATVCITASGFEAQGIIFENSFNQYISKKASEDVIVAQAGAKEGSVKRAEMKTVGDTTVQQKAYVERAAALAIYNNQTEIYFENCKFIGRQDTLYGGTGVTAAFYDCSVYGGTDYIMGPMTAVFAKCDLVFNTSEDKNDVGYITAPQQKSADVRGYLMYNCKVTSTTPGKDTASKYTSKPGYWGRVWQADTGEAVFYKTIVEASDAQYFKASPSLIQPLGWLDTLNNNARSARCGEYGTYEMAYDVYTGQAVNNGSERADWSGKVLSDESNITVEKFLDTWNPFADKDMTITVPEVGSVNNMPMGSVDASTMVLTNLGAGADGKGQVEVTWKALHKSEADRYTITVTNQDAATETAKTKVVDNNASQDGEDMKETFTGLTIDNTYEVSIGTERGDGEDKETGTPAAKTIKVSAEVSNTKYELPITLQGLSKDKKYPGGFSVTENFGVYGASVGLNSDGSLKDGVTEDPSKKKTVNGEGYTIWVQGKNNPKVVVNGKDKDPSADTGWIPEKGSVLVLDAWGDGVVTFICSNSGKNMSFVDVTANEAILKGEAWKDQLYEFEVKKGHTYYFYASGSKVVLCGAYVVYEGAVKDPNQPDNPDDPSGEVVSADGWDKNVADPVIGDVTYVKGKSAYG
ncbi:MAG: pectinesterase family protein, partial [Oxalobacter formigenes]|nr:pectinesterase family protein [Oxalobacter formigenes]